MIVKALLDAKADLNMKDNNGRTPLDDANHTDPMISGFLKSRAGLLIGSNSPRASPPVPLRKPKNKGSMSNRKSIRKSRKSMSRTRSLSPRTREEFRKSRANIVPLLHAHDDSITNPVPTNNNTKKRAQLETSREDRAISDVNVCVSRLLPTKLHEEIAKQLSLQLQASKEEEQSQNRRRDAGGKILPSKYTRPLSIHIEAEFNRKIVIPDPIVMVCSFYSNEIGN